MSHLDYYVKHGIAPVRYDLSDLSAHFQRREALYRTLGLLPLAIRGANVLEVAAGTGQNSLYLAACLPHKLTLLEPNPTGVRKLEECYRDMPLRHTRPVVVERKLEKYEPRERFDIVICENWLGASRHEAGLLRKLGRMVAPGGILVVTCVTPAGFLPNVVRRALAARLTQRAAGFEEKTRILVAAFGPHLATLGSMTRSAVDWVHDNMLNPVYFDLCLTVPMALARLGKRFQAVGVSPDFRRDWRWFKALHGAAFGFNQVMVDEYHANCHSFLDYREVHAERRPQVNKALERAIGSLIGRVRKFDVSSAGLRRDTPRLRAGVVDQIARIGTLVNDYAPKPAAALGEAARLLGDSARPSAAQVARAPNLASWFGRETIYLSVERAGRS